MVAPRDAEVLARCIAVGGVAVLPTDTVYGLACEPDTVEAVRRLTALKRRPLDKPSAVLFFALDLALAALPELGPRTQAALRALLPGAVTTVVPNPAHRFPLACGADPSALGRPGAGLAARARRAARRLAGPCCSRARTWPAARTRAPSARCRRRIRAEADLVLDGGPLPGAPSTVVDLRGFELDARWSVLREGAVPTAAVGAALGAAA